MVVKRGQSHVAVNLVTLVLPWVFGDIIVKDLRIVVQVERELRVIEMSVLLNVRIVPKAGSVPESVQRRDLVSGLDIAVAELVIGYLPDRVSPARHPREIVNRTLEISI